MDTGDVIATKTVNALVENAQTAFDDVPGWVPVAGSVSRANARARKRSGGLWVGGKAYLTTTQLRFEPNKLNRAAHTNDTAMELALSGIRAVSVERAIGMKIVVLSWSGGVAKLRCYGAAKFADQIRTAAGLS